MLPFSKLILWALFLLSLSACRSTPDMTPVPTNLGEVEVDITSGTLPPKWTLSLAEVETIEQALSALPATDFASFFDGLGYRGFVIRLNSPERRIRVQNGYVLIDENGLQKRYVDTDNQLEKWLLGASKPHIEPQLYSFLEESIGK